MSPLRKPVAASNIYTAMLALATIVILATAVYVAFKCHQDYGTIFTIVQSGR